MHVSGATNIPGAPKVPGAPADTAEPGVFAALLGGSGQPSGAAAGVEAGLGNLVSLSFGAGFGSGEGQQAEDPEAVAAVVDAAVPIQTPPLPALDDLVASLASLKTRIDAGEPLDAEALKTIEASLQALAEALNIDLGDLPSVDELAALIKSIGDKLAALLQSLNAGDLDPQKLAALGLDAEATADADLQAAIAKLLTPAVPVDATAANQVLATPALKLVEPVLSGKPNAEASAGLEIADGSVKVAIEADADADTSGSADDKPRDAKPAITIAALPDKQPDAQLAGQTTQQVSRIDAAAAPRVVQTGYQTSQQQLNLPQIAFELVRQVNDGNTRFQMRLDPPELGRIDVKLDIDAAGQVNARLTVEKAETLDLMQRDQRALEKALQQAGLDGAKTNLEFSLKQNPGGNQQGQDGNGRMPHFGGEANGNAEADDAPLPTVNLYRGSLTASGVNIIA